MDKNFGSTFRRSSLRGFTNLARRYMWYRGKRSGHVLVSCFRRSWIKNQNPFLISKKMVVEHCAKCKSSLRDFLEGSRWIGRSSIQVRIDILMASR
jgi:hypothetical protein